MTGQMRGITLMELMITLAVVGILASVAYPSYVESVNRARRADAKAVLMEAAQYIERFSTEYNRYDLRPDPADSTKTLAMQLPDTLKHAPKSGTAYYNVKIADGSLSATTYTLQAAPIVGTSMAGDKCGTLTLTQAGVQGVSDATASAQECWQR